MTHTPMFEARRLGPVALRNAVIKTATYEGMTPAGRVTDRLIAHHEALAAGGVGMTTVAYGAVDAGGRTFDDQLVVDDDNVEPLRRLTDAVHRHGAAAAIQLAHAGGFSKSRNLGGPPRGPSPAWNPYGMLSGVPRVAAMDAADMERTVSAFVAAAVRAVEAGFDAVEVHLGHGYLLSQWLSAATNRRTDDHGGSAAARRRFPLRVVEAVREALGGRAALLVKFNLRDGFAGGVELDESIETARALEAAGVDALVPSGGFVSRNAFYLLRGGRPLGAMISAEKLWTQKAALALFGPVLVRPWPWSDLFFFDDAVKLRAAVRLPIVLLAGITHREHLDRAHAAGFEFVAMGRALIADPDLVNQMIAGTAAGSRCNHCNRCVAEMDRGGVRCVLGA